MKQLKKVTKNNEGYIIVDENNNILIRIKALTPTDFIKVRDNFVTKIIENKIQTVEAYVTEVCLEFLLNVPKTKLAKDKFIEAFVNAEVYGEIVNIYKPLFLDNICNLVNSKINSTMTNKNKVEKEKETQNEVENKYDSPIKRDKKFFSALETQFKANIIGQDSAINELLALLRVKGTGLTNFFSSFFIGSTGVGKTELAKLIAKYYIGSESRVIKVNCGEYGSNHEQNKLLGSPPGYIGSDEGSLLSRYADESNEYVFIIDEIEKSSERIRELLLGVLDDGSIMDNKGNNLDFSRSIFIFTSNVGVKKLINTRDKQSIGFSSNGVNPFDEKDFLEKEMKDEFTPEFLNRIDKIIYFNNLSEKDCMEIAKLHLRKELPSFVSVSDELAEVVVKEAYSKEYGARNIRRFIRNNVALLIADQIIADGEIQVNSTYKIEVDNKKLKSVVINPL